MNTQFSAPDISSVGLYAWDDIPLGRWLVQASKMSATHIVPTFLRWQQVCICSFCRSCMSTNLCLVTLLCCIQLDVEPNLAHQGITSFHLASAQRHARSTGAFLRACFVPEVVSLQHCFKTVMQFFCFWTDNLPKADQYLRTFVQGDKWEQVEKNVWPVTCSYVCVIFVSSFPYTDLSTPTSRFAQVFCSYTKKLTQNRGGMTACFFSQYDSLVFPTALHVLNYSTINLVCCLLYSPTIPGQQQVDGVSSPLQRPHNIGMSRSTPGTDESKVFPWRHEKAAGVLPIFM